MEVPANKWIIYDGNCGLCLNSKRLLTKIGLFPDSRCLNYHELDESISAKVDPEHFRYEMALVDENSNETKYGLEGILSIFSERVSWLKLIRRGTLFFMVLEFFYHTISYNRYVLFPRKQVFKCDCDPPFVAKYYQRWMGIGVVFAAIISFFFGVVLASLFDVSPIAFGLKMLVVVGAGWILQLIIATTMMTNDQFRDYSRHIALIMVIGVSVLLPIIFLSTVLSPNHLQLLAALSALVSSVVMLFMHMKRIRFVGISQAWTLSWFLCLQISAISFALQFKILAL